jgi:hypothetical protein
MKPQRLTESEIMRKYSNIVAEAQEFDQLNEGMMDTIKSAFMKVAQKVLSPQDMQQIASIVNQATGGNPVPNKENAMKVVQALGITQQDAQQAVQSTGGQSVSEAIGPLLKQKILTVMAGAASMAGGIAAGMTTPGLILVVIGYVLMQVGALGPKDDSPDDLARKQEFDAWHRQQNPYDYKGPPAP